MPSPYDSLFTGPGGSTKPSTNPFAGIDFTKTSALPELPRTSTVPDFTPFTPEGRSSPGVGGSGGASNKSDVAGAVGAIAPLILSLFGPSNKAAGQQSMSADALAQLAQALGYQGKALTGQGQDALDPVLKYLMDLVGADPSALAQATQPERARVLDQYDTARKALEFAPRGGGTAGATLKAGAQAASDISTITASARSKAATDLGTLGKGLVDSGTAATEGASQAFNAATSQYAREAEAHDSKWAAVGSAVGTALPFILAAL